MRISCNSRWIAFPILFSYLLWGCEPTIEHPYYPPPPVNPPTPSTPYFKADAGKDITIYIPNTKVNLDASATQDTGRDIKSIVWQLVQGNTAFIATPQELKTQISDLREGTYAFELKATGKSGAISVDTVKVFVLDEFAKGVTPVIELSCDTIIRSLSEDFHILKATAHVDSGGLRYDLGEGFRFTQLSGPNVASLTPATNWPFNDVLVKNTVVGHYTFKVEVERRGLKSSNNFVLQILPDTVKGKLYQYETIWGSKVDTTNAGFVLHADIPSLEPLLLSSTGRALNISISENNGVSWTPVVNDDFFSKLSWSPFACNDGIVVTKTRNQDQSAVGKKLLVKIQVVK